MDERRIFRACKPVWDACGLTAIPNCRKHALAKHASFSGSLVAEASSLCISSEERLAGCRRPASLAS